MKNRNIFDLSKKNESGFTIMEIVVAVAIFSTAAVILTDLFMMSQKSQIKTAGKTRVQSDARFVMETIAREVRMNGIDYEYIESVEGAPSAPLILQYLPLTDVEGNQIVFAISSHTVVTTPYICPTDTEDCLAVSRNGSQWASITPEGVRVDKLYFYINPPLDPFNLGISGYSFDAMPMVTIILVTETIENDEVRKATNKLQTTVSSRYYKRY